MNKSGTKRLISFRSLKENCRSKMWEIGYACWACGLSVSTPRRRCNVKNCPRWKRLKEEHADTNG